MGALTTQADRSVAKLTEEEIIHRVVQALGVATPPFPEGPGGDCAILDTTRGGRRYRASTVDSVLLGRHFDLACAGHRAGAKLVNRNLSDLAAAGATPSDGLLSLLLGPDVDVAWLEDFAHGAGKAAAKAGLDLVGGDICRAPAGMFAGTLALQGFAHRVLTRRTATVGMPCLSPDNSAARSTATTSTSPRDWPRASGSVAKARSPHAPTSLMGWRKICLGCSGRSSTRAWT